ncbi:P-loop containing nucleoside triphosphate hydrolase protein [Mycena galopus ATCC 62051]|nr:P-loop containing nucleoside triphosphate hydrolase protein [Mycena galopus ATCC 62051]
MHWSLCTVMNFCIHSDDLRTPKMLNQIAQLVLTLQKLHSCLRAQQELGTIKRLFKKSEIAAQLDSCERELKATSEIFAMNNTVGIASSLVNFRTDIERRHQEVMELISLQSGFFDSASSVGSVSTQMHRSSLNTSSGSFSLLPASPKIFHGRDSELNDLVTTLLADPPKVAILGPGGMGKTTLALAALHHPIVIEKYAIRHFISCESVNNCADLVTTIGLHLGLELSRQLSKAIVQFLEQSVPCLVVLDNFETPWEPMESRGQVEEFLSLLADILGLALMVTMRGAERPGKIKWTRPFLPPLEPLSPSASRQIFIEVADEPSSMEESALDTLLDLSDSLPLAVSLLANIASYEGYSGTLARWNIENITLLSDGHDKGSNLEKSITLSLGSSRLSSSPHAKNLLALLSLLPDGIRTDDAIAGKVPIPDIGRWQSLLISMSLAYLNVKGRLKALSPIREYIRRVHPAPVALYSPLRIYFQNLIELWSSNCELPSGDLAPALVANLGNINELVLQSLLSAEKPALIEIGHSIIRLDSFSIIMLKGSCRLFQQLPDLIKATGDSRLRWEYTGRCIKRPELRCLIENVDSVVEEGIRHFATGTHTPTEGKVQS